MVFTYPHSVVVLISRSPTKSLSKRSAPRTLQTMLCALTGAALLAVASGAASQHSDPEVFVGYSSKEVGYVLAEELGRLIKSNEERPANKCVLVLSPLGLPQCTRACACVRARACVLVCYHFVDRSIVPSLLHSLVHPFACLSRPSVTLWCVCVRHLYMRLYLPTIIGLARPPAVHLVETSPDNIHQCGMVSECGGVGESDRDRATEIARGHGSACTPSHPPTLTHTPTHTYTHCRPFTIAISGGSLPKVLGGGIHSHALEFIKSGARPGKDVTGSDVCRPSDLPSHF